MRPAGYAVLLFPLLVGPSPGNAAEPAGRKGRSYEEAHRPQFHFTAPKGWLNDPNGLVYYAGEYHLFYQHNPAGTNWVSELSWGHAVSKDLVHWRHLPDVLPPTPRPGKPPAGSWSGSGVVDRDNTAGFQAGKEQPIVLAWTAVGLGQCIAFSNDRGRTFTRYARNPVIPYPAAGEARDPKVTWHAPTKKWVMALWESRARGVSFYASADLKRWAYRSSFPGLFECPDLFELPLDGDAGKKRWVLWDASGKYFVGRFDGKSFTREAGPFLLDYGRNYYAAQTWGNVPARDGRRLAIAWMREGQYPGMPFNQQMGVPCALALRTLPEGVRLTKRPVKELEALRFEAKEWKDRPLERGNSPLGQVRGDTFDIEMEFEPRDASAVVLKVRGAAVEYVPGLLRCHGQAAPLRHVKGRVKLRVLADRTSLEVFANDGAASISVTFLPPAADRGLELYAENGTGRLVSLRVSRMRSAWKR